MQVARGQRVILHESGRYTLSERNCNIKSWPYQVQDLPQKSHLVKASLTGTSGTGTPFHWDMASISSWHLWRQSGVPISLHEIALLISTTSCTKFYYYPLYRWGNWGTGKLHLGHSRDELLNRPVRPEPRCWPMSYRKLKRKEHILSPLMRLELLWYTIILEDSLAIS